MPAKVSTLMGGFMAKAKVPQGRLLLRLADRFALVYAALILGIDAKVLPWSKPLAGKAIYRCYKDAVAMLPDMARTLDNGLSKFKEQIRREDTIITYKSSEPPSSKEMEAADGFRRTHRSYGGKHYVLKRSRFFGWFEDRLQAQLVLQHLRDRGALFSHSTQVELMNVPGKHRYIVIKADPLSKI